MTETLSTTSADDLVIEAIDPSTASPGLAERAGEAMDWREAASLLLADKVAALDGEIATEEAALADARARLDIGEKGEPETIVEPERLFSATSDEDARPAASTISWAASRAAFSERPEAAAGINSTMKNRPRVQTQFRTAGANVLYKKMAKAATNIWNRPAALLGIIGRACSRLPMLRQVRNEEQAALDAARDLEPIRGDRASIECALAPTELPG